MIFSQTKPQKRFFIGVTSGAAQNLTKNSIVRLQLYQSLKLKMRSFTRDFFHKNEFRLLSKKMLKMKSLKNY